MALSSIGENDQIRDPDEDSHAARTVRANWDVTRQAVLRDHPWNFATLRAELAAKTNPGIIFPWTAFFPLPAGCLRMIEVLDPAGTRDCFSVENGGILADTTGPLRILYLGDVVEVGRWDAMFAAAFAKRLGFEVADRITADRGRKSDAWQAYRSALSDARGVDAKEN